jgi:serine protease AprX
LEKRNNGAINILNAGENALARIAATAGIALLANLLPAHATTQGLLASKAHGSTVDGTTYLASTGADSLKCDFLVAKQLVGHPRGRLNVIIKFQAKPGQAQLQRLQAKGADIYRHLDLIEAVAANIPSKLLRALLDDPNVVRVSSDEAVQKTDAFTVGSSLAATAWTSYSDYGSGIGVAVLDTGVTAVPDFAPAASNRLINSVVFTTDETDTKDDCGHGTHVAGIIAGSGQQSTGKQYTQTYYGVAPKANLISVKVLDHTGSGTVSQVIAGLNWCVNNQAANNIRVINMSLGHPVGQSYTTDPLCQAVEAAWHAGIVVVCASGNNGRLNATTAAGAPNGGYGTAYASVECPGNDPSVITVGAMKSTDGNRADDQIATYSGRGPSSFDFVVKPDLVAPGNKVVSTDNPGTSYLVSTYGSQVQILNSTYWTNHPGYSANYYVLSGTSMATPVVSGAVALMLAQQPTLSPDTVKARLMIGADKWTDPSGNADACTYGAGYIDIPAAMQSQVVATSPALSPSVSEDAYGNVNLSPSFLTGQNALWGTGLAGAGSVYGQRALWGTATLSSSNALWGTGFWSASATTTITSQSMNLSSSNVLLTGE